MKSRERVQRESRVVQFCNRNRKLSFSGLFSQLHATLPSLKNSGPLGTHAAVYGLSSLCVTLHPAQSVTTILQHSPSAVPARRAARARRPGPPVRPADPIEPNARSLTDSRVALHGPRVSLAPCGRPSHNVEKAQRQKDVCPGCACGPALSRPSCAGRQRCAPPRRGWRPWSPGARPWPWLRRLSWWSQEP